MNRSHLAINSLWAKKEVSPDGELLWLPLISHMYDTAHVARMIWDEWMAPGIKQVISQNLDNPIPMDNLVSFLGAAHDIGKATPVFQSKPSWSGHGQIASLDLDERLADKIQFAGLPMYPWSSFANPNATHHSLATHLILERAGCSKNIAVILGAHHGKPPSDSSLVDRSIECYGDNFHLGQEGFEKWTRLQNDLIQEALTLSNLDSLAELPIPNMIAQFLLSGLVIMADWIASNQKLFPYISVDEPYDSSLSDTRIDTAWRLLKFPKSWNPDGIQVKTSYYQERFGFEPNPVQNAVIEVATSLRNPGILIIEAPMGGGKTEAAMAAVEAFAYETKRRGIFFALPTQATTDGMFPRLLEWVNQLDEETHSINLVHSKAQFNQLYLQLFEGGSNIDESLSRGQSVVHQWFIGRKKSLLSDFVVGTIDQLLMAALRQKHVMLRHIGLAGKIVVIDECHAFDAYMNQYLETALKWLGQYQVPVILLSATLPVHQRNTLLCAYTGLSSGALDGRSSYVEQPSGKQFHHLCSAETNSVTYPVITFTDDSVIKQLPVAYNTIPLTVSIKSLDEEGLEPLLADLMSGGGCVGIIVNTIRRSQEIAMRLRRVFGADNVRLLHSRFLASERMRMEESLRCELGAPHKQASRPHLRIVVGTQVFEQSLDIDFDVLITDICPMDLLFQRIGRMHRHHRSRPEKLKHPHCYLFNLSEDSFDSGSKFIYGEYLLSRTKALLPSIIRIPDDLSTLVQRTYDHNFPINPEPNNYKIAKEAWEYKIRDQAIRAKAYRIRPPNKHKRANIVGMIDTDIDVKDQYAEAAVRDTNSTFEVLAIKTDSTGQLSFLVEDGFDSDQIPYLLAEKTPCERLAKKLAKQAIRLPLALCIPGTTLDNTIKELEIDNLTTIPCWQDSNWLEGELFLIFDSNYAKVLNGYRLIYDIENGLIYEKEENSNGRKTFQPSS